MIRIPFALLLLVLSVSAHWVLLGWMFEAFPALRRHRRRLLYLLIPLVATAPLARIVASTFRDDFGSGLFAFVTVELMIVVLGAAPLGVVRLLVALARRSAIRLRRRQEVLGPSSSTAPPHGDPSRVAQAERVDRRQVIERIAGFAVLGSTTAILGWGMVRGRHAFTIEEIGVRIPGLPRVLDGYTIAQVSDIHVGTFVGAHELDEGLDLVRRIKPDLVVVTGDLVDFDARRAPLLARALGDLTPRDGVVAIVGNHDYYSGVQAIVQTMRAAGVDVLINAGRTMRALDGGGFALLGVDDRWGRRSGGPGPDLRRAAAMVRPDAPRILLAHQPLFFDEAAGKVALQLSGHMHGGQINPGFRPSAWFADYVAGRYEKAGSTLWVNRGFGVAGPPARIGAPPEVTKVVLVAA
jgi:predicted MPP superfamily phosphohydrolase